MLRIHFLIRWNCFQKSFGSHFHIQFRMPQALLESATNKGSKVYCATDFSHFKKFMDAIYLHLVNEAGRTCHYRIDVNSAVQADSLVQLATHKFPNCIFTLSTCSFCAMTHARRSHYDETNITVALPGCSYCKEFSQVMLKLRYSYAVMYIDLLPSKLAAEVQDYLEISTLHKTRPLIFLDGSFLGGCMSLKKLQNNVQNLNGQEDLQNNLEEEESISGIPRLSQEISISTVDIDDRVEFGKYVYKQVIRLNMLYTIALGIACGVLYPQAYVKWIMTALAGDLFLRAIFSEHHSPLGLLSLSVTLLLLKAKKVPSFPFRLLSFCGFLIVAICRTALFPEW